MEAGERKHPETRQGPKNLDDLAAAVVQHQGKREQNRKKRTRVDRPRIHPVLLLALMALLGFLVWLNSADSTEAYTIPTQISLQERIYVTVLALDAAHDETGAYPADLEVVGLDDEGVVYSRGRDGYTLTAEKEGVRVEYRSGEDLEPFRAAFERLLPPFPGGL